MSETQNTNLWSISSPKTIELYWLENTEFSHQLLSNEPNTIFTIYGNPIDREEIEHLQYIRSEKQIKERNSYIIKLYKWMTPPFEIMKRIVMLAPKKDWLVLSSESEVLGIVNADYKKKGGYIMEEERRNIYSFINFLDYSFRVVYNGIMYKSKNLKFNKLVRLCKVSQKLLNMRWEITGWSKPTQETEDLHERYRAVVDYFKDKENPNELKQGKDNEMVKFANKLRARLRQERITAKNI